MIAWDYDGGSNLDIVATGLGALEWYWIVGRDADSLAFTVQADGAGAFSTSLTGIGDPSGVDGDPGAAVEEFSVEIRHVNGGDVSDPGFDMIDYAACNIFSFGTPSTTGFVLAAVWAWDGVTALSVDYPSDTDLEYKLDVTYHAGGGGGSFIGEDTTGWQTGTGGTDNLSLLLSFTADAIQVYAVLQVQKPASTDPSYKFAIGNRMFLGGSTALILGNPDSAPAAPTYTLPLRYRWRFIVVDRPTFATLTFLDGLASSRYVHRLLDQAWEAGCRVPSDSPEVRIEHDDGLPFVEEGVRFLIGLRREGGTPPYVPRFAGLMLQTQDRVDGDQPYTDITAWDSWMYLNARPVVKADGTFPGPKGISTRNAAVFADAQASTVAATLLANTIASHGSVYVDAGVAYGGTAFWDGTIEATAEVDMNFGQGQMVGDSWTQLIATGALDIVLTPIYDPVNRPGYLAELSIYAQVGSDRPDAILSWDKFPRSLVGITRLSNGQARTNKRQDFTADGLAADQIEDTGSVADFGEWWGSQTFPGQTAKLAVDGISALQLALRKRGITTVSLNPATVGTEDGAAVPIIDYDIGDRVPVYASKRLRKPLAGYQRVYGIPIDISDDDVERIHDLIVSDSGL